MHICIEGVDAAGKNTQAKMLAERMQPSKLYSFPRYDTTLGALIKAHLTGGVVLSDGATLKPSSSSGARVQMELAARVAPEDPIMFQCLMSIDKYDAANDIRADLAAGKHIVCDRYTQSALAYGIADGVDEAWLRRIQSSLPAPDLNIFINLSEEEALRRRPEVRDRYERDRDKQRKVRAIYASLWSSGGPGRWEVIDGHGSIEEVRGAIMRAVARTQVVGSGRTAR